MAEETNKEILEETDENLTEGTTDVTDETTGEGTTEGTTEGTPGEDVTDETTTGNGYLTKPYLVRNLQTFWSKIKQYITNQISGFVSKDYVDGAVGNKADKTALDTLTTTVNDKADSSTLTALETELTEKLAGKVNVEPGMGLSKNDFTDVLRTKLEDLPDSAATQSDVGFMSANDKQNLDRLVRNEIKVDTALSSTSTNPVQNMVINEALNGKADKEADPLDPSDLALSESIQGYATNEGQIVLNFLQNTKHLKIYTPKSDRPIEKVSVMDENETLFTNFQKEEDSGLTITIENPEGKKDEDSWNISAYESFNFYVENLTVDSKKYKPFILQASRLDENNLTKIELEITKTF